MTKYIAWYIVIGTILAMTSCSHLSLTSEPKPPCDPSNFDTKTVEGRASHEWCKVKETAKKPVKPKQKSVCDPSNFDMKTFRGRAAQAWCQVKEDAKKI